MNLFPKIKRCPSCSVFNLISINGIAYDNDFQSLKDWVLIKIFNCRKCKAKLGLFLHNRNQEESLIWIDFFKCQDHHYNNLLKLENNKKKYIKFKSDKKYNSTLKEIEDIQNQIRLDQVKIKIKAKIENKRMLI